MRDVVLVSAAFVLYVVAYFALCLRWGARVALKWTTVGVVGLCATLGALTVFGLSGSTPYAVAAGLGLGLLVVLVVRFRSPTSSPGLESMIAVLESDVRAIRERKTIELPTLCDLARGLLKASRQARLELHASRLMAAIAVWNRLEAIQVDFEAFAEEFVEHAGTSAAEAESSAMIGVWHRRSERVGSLLGLVHNSMETLAARIGQAYITLALLVSCLALLAGSVQVFYAARCPNGHN